MANKYALMSDKSSLETLKENLKQSSTYLMKAANSSARLSSTIDNHYQIDESQTRLSEKADDISKDIQETSDYLKNTVLPALETKISDLSREIKAIEEEERREAERREEERQRKASEIKFRW